MKIELRLTQIHGETDRAKSDARHAEQETLLGRAEGHPQRRPAPGCDVQLVFRGQAIDGPVAVDIQHWEDLPADLKIGAAATLTIGE